MFNNIIFKQQHNILDKCILYICFDEFRNMLYDIDLNDYRHFSYITKLI